MAKKMIIWVMVLTFLNLMITPDYIFARSDKNTYVDLDAEFDKAFPETDWGDVILAAAGLGIVLVVLFVLIPKLSSKAISSDDQSIDQNQDERPVDQNQDDEQPIEQNQDIEVSPVTIDKLLTPEGEFVVFRW